MFAGPLHAGYCQSVLEAGGTRYDITKVDLLDTYTTNSYLLNDIRAGQFSRDHQQVLQLNGWDHLAQEILISTPRRFGKTISVSMFAAALLFSAAAVEVSIYSTCKRISQKLLRNVVKFLV
jgi:hypothetical protein